MNVPFRHPRAGRGAVKAKPLRGGKPALTAPAARRIGKSTVGTRKRL